LKEIDVSIEANVDDSTGFGDVAAAASFEEFGGPAKGSHAWLKTGACKPE
jgi:hypothetical protein